MAKKKSKKGMKILPSVLLMLVIAVTFGFSALSFKDYTTAKYDSVKETGTIIEGVGIVKGDTAVKELKKSALKKWQVYKIGQILKDTENAVNNNATILANNKEYQALKNTYIYSIVMMVLAGAMTIPFAIDIVNTVKGKTTKKKNNVTFFINLILAAGVIVMAGLALAQLLPLYDSVSILGWTIGLAFPMIIGFGGALVIAASAVKAVKK